MNIHTKNRFLAPPAEPSGSVGKALDQGLKGC